MRRTTMSGLLFLFPQIAAHDPVPGSGTMRAVRAYLPHDGRTPRWRDLAADSAHVNVSVQDGHVIINATAREMAGVDGCLQSSSMSHAECAERIRLQYLGSFSGAAICRPGFCTGLPRGCRRALRSVAPEAHRLAWGWTVAQAVEEFHRMCRREKIEPRGLTMRSWMDWEAGARPNWDYQDLLSRLSSTASENTLAPEA